MLDTLGEATARIATRVATQVAGTENDQVLQQVEKIREVRPVEKAENGQGTELKKEQKEPSTKYNIEDSKIVFEKYDKNGNLIVKIPPSTTVES